MVKGFSCTGRSTFPMGKSVRIHGVTRGVTRDVRAPGPGAANRRAGSGGRASRIGGRKENFAQAGTSVKPAGQQSQVIFGFGASCAIVVGVETRSGGGARLQNFAENLLGRARPGSNSANCSKKGSKICPCRRAKTATVFFSAERWRITAFKSSIGLAIPAGPGARLQLFRGDDAERRRARNPGRR